MKKRISFLEVEDKMILTQIKTSLQRKSISSIAKLFQEIGMRSFQYYKNNTENPEWILMNAISRFYPLRSLIRVFRNNYRLDNENNYDTSNSLFHDLDVDNLVDSLKTDGFFTGIKLPPIAFQEIISFALSSKCYGNLNHDWGFTYFQKKQAEEKCKKVFSTATYYNLDLLCPYISKLAHDPKLLLIAAKYFGTKPVYTDSRLWWTFPASRENYDVSKTASFFHYDIDDYNCLRFFFYLTDVNLQSGPHVLIRGSHRRKKLSQIISLEQRKDEDIVNFYGDKNIVTICGEAGSGFAEDPFCFHKATRPLQSDRLLLQLRYATKDYGVLKSTTDLTKLKNII